MLVSCTRQNIVVVHTGDVLLAGSSQDLSRLFVELRKKCGHSGVKEQGGQVLEKGVVGDRRTTSEMNDQHEGGLPSSIAWHRTGPTSQ